MFPIFVCRWVGHCPVEWYAGLIIWLRENLSFTNALQWTYPNSLNLVVSYTDYVSLAQYNGDKTEEEREFLLKKKTLSFKNHFNVFHLLWRHLCSHAKTDKKAESTGFWFHNLFLIWYPSYPWDMFQRNIDSPMEPLNQPTSSKSIIIFVQFRVLILICKWNAIMGNEFLFYFKSRPPRP